MVHGPRCRSGSSRWPIRQRWIDFLGVFAWCAVFKAGTSDKTFEAWRAGAAGARAAGGRGRRPDPASGRVAPASDHVAARSGIPHRSPQLSLFHHGAAALSPRRACHPARAAPRAAARSTCHPTIGPACATRRRFARAPIAHLLEEFVAGTLPEERFQWALSRSARRRRPSWRDDEAFELLNGVVREPLGPRRSGRRGSIAHRVPGAAGRPARAAEGPGARGCSCGWRSA